MAELRRGDQVRVVQGPCLGCTGQVAAVGGQITVVVPVFGHRTRLEFAPHELERFQ